MCQFLVEDQATLKGYTEPSINDRKLFCEIATGMVNIATDWFAGLAFAQTPPIAENHEQGADVHAAGGEQEPEDEACGDEPEEGAGSIAGEASAGRKQELEAGLKTMFEELAQKLREDEMFEAPIQNLLSNYRKIQTDSALISACFSFGKDRLQTRAATTTTVKLLKLRARRCLQTGTSIGVQPTTVARRKAPLGGRRAPPKRAWREHGYGK